MCLSFSRKHFYHPQSIPIFSTEQQSTQNHAFLVLFRTLNALISNFFPPRQDLFKGFESSRYSKLKGIKFRSQCLSMEVLNTTLTATLINEDPFWDNLKYKVDMGWNYYSIWVLTVPYGIIWLYKFLNPIDWEIVFRKDYKKSLVDHFLTWSGLMPVIYYFMDSLCLIMLGRWRYPCCASFILHHVLSCFILPVVCFVPYWSWFWLFPGFVHCLLLVAPDWEDLNYLYLLSIFCYQYGLYVTPLGKLKNYRIMKDGITIIELVVIPLWWFECKNTLPAPIA